jgi:hypothetical protein
MESAQVSSCEKSDSKTSSNQPANTLVSFFSKNMIQTIVMIVTICIIIYLLSQIKTMSEKINTMARRIEEHDLIIDRHEMVLKKIMTLLNNMQSSPKKSMDTISEIDDESVAETVKSQVQQSSNNPSSHLNDIGSFMSMVLPMLSPPSMHIPPVRETQQDYPLNSISELDSELKDEIIELSAK